MAGNQFKTDELGGLTFSATYTTQQYPLGTVAEQHPDDLPATTIEGTVVGNSGVSATTNFALLTGNREWVFVYAKEVIAAGQLCEWDFDHGVAYSVEPSDANDTIVNLLAGVADNAIAAGSYGWIIKKGTCVVLAGTGVAAGSPLASHTTEGSVDEGGAAGTTIGVGLEADGTTLASYAQAYISIP